MEPERLFAKSEQLHDDSQMSWITADTGIHYVQKAPLNFNAKLNG
jgi:hypothetical protein